MWYGARGRAKKAGVPFSIERRDIIIPDRCPALGTKLVRGKGQPGPNSPSLDRIVPELGYVPGNIVVVSMRANRAKNDLTVAEMRALAVFYTTNTKE